MAWNKRGSTSGGASTGRSGVKRGGTGGSPQGRDTPDVEADYGKRGGGRSADLDPVEFADCVACNGTGNVVADKVETDEEGGYSGTQEAKCSACGGTGRIKIGRR
jgi:hypothetical protein